MSSSGAVPRVDIGTGSTGMFFTVNGTTYNLIKYLGGGSFGRVWSAKVGSDKRMVKFIKITGDPRAREKALKEVEVGRLLHEDEPDICPAIYNVCQTTMDGDEYIMICGQKYTLTLERYMTEVERILDPERAKERGCDILKAFLASWKDINGLGHCNHGDAKPDNFMFLKGKIKWIDLGFVHYQKRGKNIICSSSNAENNQVNRDLVQFAIFMYFFKRAFLPDRIYDYVRDGILPQMDDESWKGGYAYLNSPRNRHYIAAHAKTLEDFLEDCEEAEFTQIDDSEEAVPADDALIDMLEEELDSDLFTPIPSMPSNPAGLRESLVHDTGFYYLEREPTSPTPPAGGWLARYPEAAAAALAEFPAFAGGKGLAKAAPVESLRLTEGRSQIPLNSASAASIRRVASEVAEGGVPYGGLPYGGLPYGAEVYGDVFGGDPYQGMYIEGLPGGLSGGLPAVFEGVPTPRGRGGRRKQKRQTRHKKQKSNKRARATRRR